MIAQMRTEPETMYTPAVIGLEGSCVKCAKEIPLGSAFCPWCGRKQEQTRKRRTRSNGLGTVYKLPDGKWAAVKTVGWIVDPLPEDAPAGAVPHKRRQTVKRRYATRKEAEAALPFLTAADRHPRQGTVTQRKGTAITLRELYDQWEPTHGKSQSTMNCYRAGFRVFAPLWNVKMTELDVDDLQDCMDDSDAGRRTLENAKAALGLVYKYGIPRDCIPKDRNLAQFLRINASGGGKKSGFSLEELERIRKAAASGDPFAAIVLCHCYLGFRPTALLALTAKDYDADRRCFVGGIKTEAGKGRTVTVSPKIQRYVDTMLASADDGNVFGRLGAPIGLKDYREHFYVLLEGLGIENPIDEDGRHRLTPHSCRHTFATLLKRAQGSDTDKLALIGHTSTDQLRDYQDVPLEDLRAITDQL